MRKMMVMVATTAIALAALAGSPRAQAVWNFEAVGGINFSQLTGSDTGARVLFSETDIGSGEVSGDIGGMRVGFSVGALVTVDVNDYFGVQSGFQWTRRGGDGNVRLRGDITGIGTVDLTADVTMTLDYIEIPILGVFSFPVGQTTRLRTLVGPVLAFNTKADAEVSFAGVSQSEDIGDSIKSFDLGGLLGVGIGIPVGAVQLLVDARYTMGFTSIDDSGSSLDIKNGEFTVLAGVGIRLTP